MDEIKNMEKYSLNVLYHRTMGQKTRCGLCGVSRQSEVASRVAAASAMRDPMSALRARRPARTLRGGVSRRGCAGRAAARLTR